MIDALLSMYTKGAITADHLVVQCLHSLDPNDPGLVLAELPAEILARVRQYAADYRPHHMRTNYGLQPTTDQVASAKEWLEAKIAT